MANPKLEFYRFTLNHKDGSKKTFRDFVTEELGEKSSISNEEVFKKCFDRFIKKITTEHARSAKKKKTITLIEDEKRNPFKSLKPSMSSSNNTLSGVINGGYYDKEAIVSNIADKEDASDLGKDKAVLFPYFVFAYFPADHFEGFFIVHSNSREDSIADIFRSYVTNVFSGEKFNKAIASSYCPARFQKEFKDGAVIKDMVFSTTVIDNAPSNDPIQTQINGYKVEIKISQIKDRGKKKLSLGALSSIFDKIKQNGYLRNGTNIPIEDFHSKKVVLEKEKGKKNPKTFEYNSIDNDFVPVVLLEDKVKINDGIPDFNELKTYCANLFSNDILREIRPDLYVTKSV